MAKQDTAGGEYGKGEREEKERRRRRRIFKAGREGSRESGKRKFCRR